MILSKLKEIILRKKFLIIILIIVSVSLIFAKNFFAKKEFGNRYLFAIAKKGEIEEYVSGNGNIVAVESFDIKPKVNGRIIYLGIKEGSFVKKGDILAKLDDKEIKDQIDNKIRQLERIKLDIKIAQREIENAKINLNKIQQEYENLKRGDETKDDYKNALRIINNFFISYPQDLEKIKNIYFEKDLDKEITNIKYYFNYYSKNFPNKDEDLKREYDILKKDFISLSENFKEIKDSSDINYQFISDVNKFLDRNLIFIKEGLDQIRKIKEDLSFSQSKHINQNLIESHFNILNSNYDKYLDYLNQLTFIINNLNRYKDSFELKENDLKNLDNIIKQRENSLEKLINELKNTEEDLKKLQDDLEDYIVYSPLNGYVSNLFSKLYDNVNLSTPLMTIVSQDKIVEIKLNEIDLANVKVGNKAILTFDSFPNKKINGEVIYISPTGEISQGVVWYKLKISFRNDPNIRIGMTVNADIITKSKRNVLIIPKSTLKRKDNKYYVEIPNPNEKLEVDKDKNFINLNYPPQIVEIKTGLEDENNIQILEGLKENDIVLIKKL
ncbi:MAG: efflux RND transporter periplasmic adaptor subunit [Patescibacteria group bacterium]|nr:efflux RND transporter periplasmic adaptor subunit [Patescibacteria group bacterium]